MIFKKQINQIAYYDYTHKLEERKEIELGDYGIDLAEQAGLPPNLIHKARGILKAISVSLVPSWSAIKNVISVSGSKTSHGK